MEYMNSKSLGQGDFNGLGFGFVFESDQIQARAELLGLEFDGVLALLQRQLLAAQGAARQIHQTHFGGFGQLLIPIIHYGSDVAVVLGRSRQVNALIAFQLHRLDDAVVKLAIKVHLFDAVVVDHRGIQPEVGEAVALLLGGGAFALDFTHRLEAATVGGVLHFKESVVFLLSRRPAQLGIAAFGFGGKRGKGNRRCSRDGDPDSGVIIAGVVTRGLGPVDKEQSPREEILAHGESAVANLGRQAALEIQGSRVFQPYAVIASIGIAARDAGRESRQGRTVEIGDGSDGGNVGSGDQGGESAGLDGIRGGADVAESQIEGAFGAGVDRALVGLHVNVDVLSLAQKAPPQE